MKIRFLAILLTLCMTLTMLPLSVAAYSGTDVAYPVEGGNLYFDKATGTITDCDNSVTGADIPAEIDGVAVTGIGDEAFAECYKLAYVNIPDAVEKIGFSAFDHTAIFDSAAALPEDGYYYEGIFGPDYWVNGVLYIDHWLIAADYIGVCLFPEYDGAWNNGNYSIRQGTVGIAEGAFSNCSSSLTSVTIPDSMTEISEGALWGCGSLISVTIPDSVTKIGDNAFYCCGGLKNVTIPGSVMSIGDQAFGNCTDLTNVTISESVTSIGCNAFEYCTSLKSVTIPGSVTCIGCNAFGYCTGLTSVTISEGVTSIGEGAFCNCSRLTSVTIPGSVTSIGCNAFEGCTGLTSVTISEGVASIGDGAFRNCSSLTSVTIPGSVTGIGGQAFYSCNGLTSVAISEGVASIGDGAFCNCGSLTSVTIPGSVTSIGNGVFCNCGSLTEINVPEGNTAYASENGVLFNKSQTILLRYPIGKTDTEYTIPNSVTSIGCNALEGCTGLTSVTVPDCVTDVGDDAFCGCVGLQAVYFMGDAPAIGGNVFKKRVLDDLYDPFEPTYTYINIPGLVLYYIEGKAGWTSPTWNDYPTETWSGAQGSEPEVDEIAYPVKDGNLYFRKSTGEIYGCDDSVTSADIPAEIDGVAVTGIGDSAFKDCDSLTSVTIPEGVTSIGNYGFYFCGNLQSVYFMGDAPELGNNVFDISNIWYDEPVIEIEDISIRGLVLYYLEVKEGWTTPTWNGYSTEIWERENEPDPAADEIAYPVEGGNLYFRKSTGEIFDCGQTVTKADIPAEIDGVAVTKIGVDGLGCGAFENCAALTEVTIPNSVTEISDYAFSGCTALMSVTIPDSVTSIGKRAFYWCDSLTSVTLPSSVTSIDEYTFSRCGKLTNITIPNSVTSINYGAFSCCSSLASVTIPESVTSIGFYVFSECTGLTSVTIPESVTNIPAFAFNGCSSLTNVTVPSSVTVIKISAFEDCTGLQSAYFMGDAPVLEENAFSIWDTEEQTYINNPGLTLYYIDGKADWTTPTWNGYPTAIWDGVNVPEPADEIAYPVEGGNLYFRKSTGEIFDCDTTVTNADIPEKIVGVAVTTIGDHAFYKCSSLTSVTIPDSVTGICDSAFFACSSLTSVTIPEGVKSIGKQAFSYCSSLTSVTISGSVTSIGGYAFSYCSSLESVTIPGSVTSISDRTFYWCDSLSTVTILEGVTSIGGLAFGHCTGLTSVTIPDSVTNIGMSAFDNCSSLTSVTIPESVTSIGEGAFCDCSSLTAIHVAEGNTAYTSENGVLFDKNKTLLHTYPAGKTESEYIIPESVISIGSHAFYRCSNLTNVTIPVGVTSIVNYAFFMCSSLKSVTIPEGVKSISRRAFYGCSSLTSVTIPEGVKSIGISAFDACSSLTSVTIPGSVTSIGGYAFYACGSLQSLYFMGAAPALEAYAFSVWNAETQTYINNPNLILYYIDGKEGWTTPTWNSYPTATWMPVHEHSYVVVVTAPTCTERGCTTHTCSICCDTYTDTYKEALGHDYGEWTLIKAATCTEKGEEKRTCSRCYSFETRETDAAGHTEVIDAAVPATCTEAGKTEGKHCDLCGMVIVAQETVAALGHDFGDWTQTKAPTCTEKGEEKRTCSRCDAFETREIAAHGHTEVVDPAVPATCTEAGKTEGKHCSVCGTVLAAQEEVAALGHQYENGLCSVCGEKSAVLEFSDIPTNAWYVDAVDYAVRSGLMKGVGGGKFEPEGTMTRAMLVTVLWRYEGEPAEGENIFADVPNGTWYTGAVAWAAANGIVGGVGNGRFDPTGNITREQMAAILFRYAQQKGYDTSKRAELSKFPDNGKVSDYAREALAWANAEGLINGDEQANGTVLLDPAGNATRAQVAAILMRYVENIVK